MTQASYDLFTSGVARLSPFVKGVGGYNPPEVSKKDLVFGETIKQITPALFIKEGGSLPLAGMIIL
jgi:hypothetical protein